MDISFKVSRPIPSGDYENIVKSLREAGAIIIDTTLAEGEVKAIVLVEDGNGPFRQVAEKMAELEAYYMIN